MFLENSISILYNTEEQFSEPCRLHWNWEM